MSIPPIACSCVNGKSTSVVWNHPDFLNNLRSTLAHTHHAWLSDFNACGNSQRARASSRDGVRPGQMRRRKRGDSAQVSGDRAGRVLMGLHLSADGCLSRGAEAGAANIRSSGWHRPSLRSGRRESIGCRWRRAAGGRHDPAAPLTADHPGGATEAPPRALPPRPRRPPNPRPAPSPAEGATSAAAAPVSCPLLPRLLHGAAAATRETETGPVKLSAALDGAAWAALQRRWRMHDPRRAS